VTYSAQAVEVVAYMVAAAFLGMVAVSTTSTEEVAGAAPAVMEDLGELATIIRGVEEEEGVAAELLRMVVQLVNPAVTAGTDVVVMADLPRLILAVKTATTVRALAEVVVADSHTTRYWE